MYRTFVHRIFPRAAAAVVLSALCSLSAAAADSVELRSGTGTFTQPGTVTGVRNGNVVIQTPSGSQSEKALDSVIRIRIDSEPGLTTAEDAYVAEQWDQAANAYSRLIAATRKDWVKTYATGRMLDAAGKSGRFDLVIQSYVPALLADPESAKAMKLTFPKPDSRFFSDAISFVKQANRPNLTAEQKKNLTELLVQLYQAKNDAEGLRAALKDLAQIDPTNPIAQSAMVKEIVLTLQSQLKAGQYDQVIGTINKDEDRFTDPADQAQVLLMLADAQAGKLGQKDDPEAWKDVAIAYMRVPAAFPPDTPGVGEALLKTGEIIEIRLKDKASALALYQQIAAEQKGHPAGQKADENVKRLKAS